MQTPAIDGYGLMDHGGDGATVGPDQRQNRMLTDDDVALIRQLVAAGVPIHRIWRQKFDGIVSYHTVRRAALRLYYKEQP